MLPLFVGRHPPSPLSPSVKLPVGLSPAGRVILPREPSRRPGPARSPSRGPTRARRAPRAAAPPPPAPAAQDQPAEKAGPAGRGCYVWPTRAVSHRPPAHWRAQTEHRASAEHRSAVADRGGDAPGDPILAPEPRLVRVGRAQPVARLCELRTPAKCVDQPETDAAEDDRERRRVCGHRQIAGEQIPDLDHIRANRPEAAKRQGEQIETSGRELWPRAGRGHHILRLLLGHNIARIA